VSKTLATVGDNIAVSTAGWSAVREIIATQDVCKVSQSMSFEVPILLCIFNRPTLTQQVFSQIAKQKPKRLLIIADGPRIQNLQDVELVAKTREIVSQVDWQCEVSTNFSAQNLGCRQRMATGIS